MVLICIYKTTEDIRARLINIFLLDRQKTNRTNHGRKVPFLSGRTDLCLHPARDKHDKSFHTNQESFFVFFFPGPDSPLSSFPLLWFALINITGAVRQDDNKG